jgi:hypothetical protein
MPRQRHTGRRWPFGWRVRRRRAMGTVPLLDTISLTAFMTDPAEPEMPPVSRTGSDVLHELPDWEVQQAAALAARDSGRERPRLEPAGDEAMSDPDADADADASADASAARLVESEARLVELWSSAVEARATNPPGDAELRPPEPPDSIDLLAVVEMPTNFAWGSALDLLGALDDAAAEKGALQGTASPSAVEHLDAIVGPVGAPGAPDDDDDDGDGDGNGEDEDDPGDPFGAETGPAYLPIPEPSAVVVPDEVIPGPSSSGVRPDHEPGEARSSVAEPPMPPVPPTPPGIPPAGKGASGAAGTPDGKRGRRARRASIITGLGACLLVGGCLVSGGVIPAHSEPAPSATPAGTDDGMFSPVVARLLGGSSRPLDLPPATTTPTPAPPSVASAATSSHEVFGYAPYWSLSQQSSFPVGDFSTLAYFSVDVNPDGTVQESGPGWEGYRSQALVNLVSRAHAAGDRVVLTATDFAQPSLDAITHDPDAGRVLGENLLSLVEAKHLDGVNLDFEGNGSADQGGLDRLVAGVGAVLRGANPNYQFTVSTYASSAGDPNGFYDIRGLARSVDGFFVMADDIDQGPATGPSAGGGPYPDAMYVHQYVAAVGASKVILGLPLFGYDMTTTGPALGDAVTGSAQAVTDAQALASGPTYWDAASDTAWTAYRAASQWHQVFFDNANTLSLKEQLAVRSGLLGVGAWALGMEGSDDSLLTVLDGGAPPSSVPPIGPSVPPGSGGSAPGGGGATTTAPGGAVSQRGRTGTGTGGRVSGAGGSSAGHRHRGSSTGSGSTTTTTRPKTTSTTTSTTRPPRSTTTTSTSTTTTTAPQTTTTTTRVGTTQSTSRGTSRMP